MDREEALRELWRTGAREPLVTQLLQGYGPEILSYLCATLRGEGEAAEAFSQFALNLWEASRTFRGDSSFRTWAYVLARHAVGRVVRERGRRRRGVPLSGHPALEALAARVRTATFEHLRTEAKDKLAQLREELDPDEQTMLILRVDRQLTWPEIAKVLAEPSVPALRKRFERLKEKLKQRFGELG